MRQFLVYFDFVENPHFSNPISDFGKDFIILTEGVAKCFRRNLKQKQNYNWVTDLK